ncbi:unnamed protein product, partial [Rotaria sp. Silwood1]
MNKKLLSLILIIFLVAILDYPLRSPSSTNIHPNARWQQNGITVAGGNRQGNGINQL